MNPNKQAIYEQYKEVVHDMIVGRRSTKRILARTYTNDQGEEYKVPEDMIDILKQIASAKRDEVMDTKTQEPTMSNTQNQQELGFAPSNQISKPKFNKMDGFEQQTLNVYMQNAQMNAQIGFLQQQLRDKQNELDQLRGQGLGSIETQIDYQFTKRKNQELSELVSKQEAEIKVMEKELDELQGKADRMHELQGYAEMAKSSLPELLQAYAAIKNPAAAQNSLAGAPQLSDIDKQALQTGQYVFQAFNNDQDYNKLLDIMNACSQDKSLLNTCLEAISKKQQQVKKTKRTTEEVEYGEAAA